MNRAVHLVCATSPTVHGWPLAPLPPRPAVRVCSFDRVWWTMIVSRLNASGSFRASGAVQFQDLKINSPIPLSFFLHANSQLLSRSDRTGSTWTSGKPAVLLFFLECLNVILYQGSQSRGYLSLAGGWFPQIVQRCPSSCHTTRVSTRAFEIDATSTIANPLSSD